MRGLPRPPFEEPAPVDPTDRSWMNGRLVLRRPEAPDSMVRGLYIPMTEVEAAQFSQTLVESVEVRRARSPQEREAELQALAVLAIQQGIA